MRDGSAEQADASQDLALGSRTRGLLRAAALMLRSVCPEDRDTDILLHDMARQIEAKLNAASGRPADPGGQVAADFFPRG